MDQLAAEGIDPRILNLSYSSILTLHSCPRKLQLERLNDRVKDTTPTDQNITFSFGHAVGEGVQAFFEGATLEQAVWRMMLRWEVDLAAEQEKKRKSIWHAISALQQLYAMREVFSKYELVYYSGAASGKQLPAVELGFLIDCPDGFKFRGFIDVVVRDTSTGEIVVIEVKTTGSNSIHPAQYKNSAQAMGYSVVLDSVVPGYSSYKVVYLIYCTVAGEWEQMEFPKTLLQRARWIQQLLLDIETIKLYEAAGYYPQHGQSCYDYYRECQFFGNCGLDTKYITVPLTAAVVEQLRVAQQQFSIRLSVADLIQSQIGKQ